MDAPAGKKYEGPSGAGRDSIWLTAEDLIEGRDATAEIDAVMMYPSVKFQGGRERKNMIGLTFKGKERVLGLNATNRKVLNRMFGNLTKSWPGKSVTLYVSETQLAGETVKCVRIRDKGSRVATAAEEFLEGDHEAEPTRGSDITPERGAFDEAVAMTGTSLDQAAAILSRSDGDYVAALAEINRRANLKAST
jgi:hypothetical protein